MNLNHVMIYVRDVPRALEFYVGVLGLTPIEVYPEGYARLRFPEGDATLALHSPEPGRSLNAAGIRIYFEVEDLDERCAELVKQGVVFKQMPADKPWGWRHAYLLDPDGHEVSLYWAGEKRLEANARSF